MFPAGCITSILRWPAGQAASLAHPLAAEALVAALERLRDAAPGPDSIRFMGVLVLALTHVYTYVSASELGKEAAASHWADYTAQTADSACAAVPAYAT